MNYKLSVNTQRQTIENTFKRHFLFPNIYKSHKIIEGTKETTLPIITTENSEVISQGIWGLLPDNYENDWNTFQKSLNTLNVRVKDLESKPLFKDAFYKRRCLILVTGIYISYLKERILKTVLIQKEDKKPFTLAGIYNKTQDGFITCTIINTKKKENIIKNEALLLKMPLIINEDNRTIWLNRDAEMKTIIKITKSPNEMNHYTTTNL